MIPRKKQSDIREALTRFPVVAIVGPRQVGKIKLARTLAAELRDGQFARAREGAAGSAVQRHPRHLKRK